MVGNVQMSAALERARQRAQGVFRSLWRTQDHGGLIRSLLADVKAPAQRRLVFVETGCGLSTFALAEVAARVGAVVYSCEVSGEAVAELRARGAEALADVHFVEGDSLDSLARIAARHEQIDFALFDSAPSATHTLREFQLLEPRLAAGARVLVDDAALPGARLLLSPCRKGKLLVPYLLASPFWRVRAHPRAGDSMVSAVHDRVGARADATYEDPAYVDRWREVFT
jgi:predicted O-methyltransferase YrrM